MDWDSPPLNPNLLSSSVNKPFRSGRRSSAGARSLFSAPSSVADAPGCGRRCLTRYPDPRRRRTYNAFRRLLPLQFDRGLTASSGRRKAVARLSSKLRILFDSLLGLCTLDLNEPTALYYISGVLYYLISCQNDLAGEPLLGRAVELGGVHLPLCSVLAEQPAGRVGHIWLRQSSVLLILVTFRFSHQPGNASHSQMIWLIYLSCFANAFSHCMATPSGCRVGNSLRQSPPSTGESTHGVSFLLHGLGLSSTEPQSPVIFGKQAVSVRPFRSGRRSSAGARSLFSAPSSVADAPGCGKRCLTRYPDPCRRRTYNAFRRLLPLQFDRGLTASSGRRKAVARLSSKLRILFDSLLGCQNDLAGEPLLGRAVELGGVHLPLRSVLVGQPAGRVGHIWLRQSSVLLILVTFRFSHQPGNASHSQMIWLIYLSCFANAFSHCMATPSGCRVGTTFRPARGLSRWSLRLCPHLHSRVIKD
ncbi:hypothetical protein SASPL_135207 [Salvia splendens]|uniref:Uncharacterized protein n=1 Tax=Salvia splendens TaxID=180675 RepID=A0A8X8ZFK2_SALSN|nr:hypothetical protein SASPL_135207 [Salvia splendens]